jgi:hypothetical protein
MVNSTVVPEPIREHDEIRHSLAEKLRQVEDDGEFSASLMNGRQSESWNPS